jgi:3-oxoacyl-[acyl-carrier-protein] synthase-3
MNVQITAIGHYLPDQVITNDKLSEKYKGFDHKSIFKRTGIKERRYAGVMTTGDMIVKSINNLLIKSNKRIEDIQLIIVGTLTPDYVFPSTAVSVINSMGAKKAWGFDISAACSGFCYGLHIATKLIKDGGISNAIVCGAEKMSATLNDFDYKTGILFGDGAGAVLLENTMDEKNIIIDSICKVEADDLNDVYYKSPWNTEDWEKEKFELSGQKVYKNGVHLTVEVINKYLESRSKSINDFDYIVPHQANMRMLTEIGKGLNIELDKFLINIENVGNTGGASIPICLSEMYLNGKLEKGDKLLLCSFGSGYTTSVVELVWSI